jgi:DNA-binding PadR family transcriptional regulator
MPTDALRNPLVLPILGLLAEQPRHGYAVFSELRNRYDYLTVRNSSVYTLLDRLVEAGWIARDGESGGAVMTPTPTGVAALSELVETQVREGDLTGGHTFVAALAYIGILPRDRAAAVLRTRAERVRALREPLLQLAHATEAAEEVHMIEVAYLASRLGHDVRWLEALARRTETGDLAWRPSI